MRLVAGKRPSLGSSILAAVAGLSPGTRAAVLIRHSVRGSIEDEGPDAPLTQGGRELARLFGTHLLWDGTLIARPSPRTRCIETAREIVEGFRQAHPNAKASLLDSGESVSSILHGGQSQPALDVLLNRIQRAAVGEFQGDWGFPADMVDFAESAAKEVVGTVARTVNRSSPGSLHLYVDHDLHLIILREHVLGTRFSRKEWLDILDGFVLASAGDGSYVVLTGNRRVRYWPIH